MFKRFGFAPLVALLLAAPALKAAPAEGQDCYTLGYMLFEAQDGMNQMNGALSYDALTISWDIGAGLGPGNPIYDADMAQTIQDGHWYDNYAGAALAIQHQMHQAKCY